MAEHVQAVLDRMVPGLVDLQEQGILSSDEVTQVVARRRASEYALRRRAPRLSDALAYITAETILLRLVQLREQKLRRSRGRATETNTKKRASAHVMQLVHLVWVRTLRKYRAHLDLFHQYATFCAEQKSYTRLAACYQDALRFHASSVEVWVAAASHEYFHRHALAAARILFQRALRLHAASPQVWLQFVRLELHAAQKMRGRRLILQGSTHGGDVDNDMGPSNDTESKEYKIAALIYNQAITAIAPHESVSFRLDCLRTCSEFPDTQTLQQLIMTSLQDGECAASPTAWIARAVYQQQQNGPHAKRHKASDENRSSRTDPVLDIIRQACETVSTEAMFLAAIDFLDSMPGDEDVSELVHYLFVQAKTSGVFRDQLALRQANYLEASLDRDDWDEDTSPIAALKRHVEQCSATATPSAAIWMKWASLELDQGRGMAAAIAILKRACRSFPMHHADHAVVYGQLFCVYVEDTSEGHARSDTLQQVLILSTKQHCDNFEYPVVPSMPNLYTAIRQYLLFSCLHEDKAVYRKNCDAVLSSTFLRYGAQQHTNVIRMLLEDMMDGEEAAHVKRDSHRLVRLYDTAIQTFQGLVPDLTQEFRQLKADKVLYHGNSQFRRTKDSSCDEPFDVPIFDLESPDFDIGEMEQTYQTFQIVCVKNAASNYSSHNSTKSILHWRDIGTMFQGLDAKDKASWSIETMTTGNSPVSPVDFLAADTTSDRAYCSFLVQHDTNSYTSALQRLPFAEFPSTKWEYEPALWVFFCRNPLGHGIMDGRPEHTDAITHDGTWHFQLSGTKRWLLRPTDELNARLAEQGLTLPSDKTLQIDCQEGDVIVVNTKLWFHHTMIPPQARPSVSYARDFSIGDTEVKAKSEPGGMTNLDGLYATNDIKSGTVVFTESDMPDCELHRSSTSSNCEVVELEDGTNAVVSTRAISAGEFFCVPESSEDENSQGEEAEESEPE